MNRLHWRASFCLCLLVLISFATMASAQVPEGDATSAQPQPQQSSKNLLTMIKDSGLSGIAFLGALGLFSLVAGSIIVERLVNMRRQRVIPSDFLTDLDEQIQKKQTNPKAYLDLTEDYPSPIAKILRAGLLRAGRPATEVEKAMEDAASREVATLRSGVRPLTVIGSVAPLVGLLGTVVGMIIAFHTASESGLGGKAETLAKGIYLALLTTAAGLSIAIPSMMFAAFFHNRIEKYLRETDETLMEVVPLLTKASGTDEPYPSEQWTDEKTVKQPALR